MTQAQLLEKGFTEEQAKTVLKLHEDSIKDTYVPLHRFNEVNTELKTVKTQVTERDTQIGELKKFQGTSDELQKKVTELEDANKTKDTEFETKLKAERKTNAIKLALLADEENKPHDITMVMGQFNLDNIIVNDDGKVVSGMTEQVANIRKDKAFLFAAVDKNKKKPPGFVPKGKTPQDGDEGNDDDEGEKTSAFGASLAQKKLTQMGIQPKKET